MFALEEAISFFEPLVIIRTLFICFLTYIVVGVITKYKYIGGQFLASEYGMWPVEANCQSLISYLDFFSFIAMGLCSGVLGHLYNRLVITVVKLRLKYLGHRPLLRLAEVALVTVLTMTVVVLLPLAFDNCTPYAHAISHLSYQRDSCQLKCPAPQKSTYLDSNPICLQLACFPSNLRNDYEKVRYL